MIKDYQLHGLVKSVVGPAIADYDDPIFEVCLDQYDRLSFHWIWGFQYVGPGLYSPHNLMVDYYCMTWASGRYKFTTDKQIIIHPTENPDFSYSTFWHHGGNEIKGFQFWRNLRDALQGYKIPHDHGMANPYLGSAQLLRIDRPLVHSDFDYLKNFLTEPPQ